MFSLLTFFLGLIINLSKSKKQLLAQISLQQKELEILKRHYRKKRVRFVHSDRIILSILNRIGYIKDHLSIIIYHQTREIAHVAIAMTPCREFVRQQLIEFGEQLSGSVYMIHDNAAQFNLNYLAYGIKEICTSVKAPNMNAIAERFIGSVRREALDYFLLISEQQILNILQEYID